LEGVYPENSQHAVQNTEYTCSKTQVHKITNLTDFYMALGLNDCDAGKSITQAIGRGGPRNSQLFWVQMALASLAGISGAKKS
jgi:hypothetical protein